MRRRILTAFIIVSGILLPFSMAPCNLVRTRFFFQLWLQDLPHTVFLFMLHPPEMRCSANQVCWGLPQIGVLEWADSRTVKADLSWSVPSKLIAVFQTVIRHCSKYVTGFH